MDGSGVVSFPSPRTQVSSGVVVRYFLRDHARVSGVITQGVAGKKFLP